MKGIETGSASTSTSCALVSELDATHRAHREAKSSIKHSRINVRDKNVHEWGTRRKHSEFYYMWPSIHIFCALEKPNRATSKNSGIKCAQRELLLLSTQTCASIYETMCIGEAGRSRPLQIAQFIIENKCYYPQLSVYI